MRHSRYWTAIAGVLLVWAALAGATGGPQRSADGSKHAPLTQATAVAEQVTGSTAEAAAPAAALPIAPQSGNPSATTSIPGNQLPPPDPKFGGAEDSNGNRARASAGQTFCSRLVWSLLGRAGWDVRILVDRYQLVGGRHLCIVRVPPRSVRRREGDRLPDVLGPVVALSKRKCPTHLTGPAFSYSRV